MERWYGFFGGIPTCLGRDTYGMLEAWKHIPGLFATHRQTNSLTSNETESMHLRSQERSCYAYY